MGLFKPAVTEIAPATTPAAPAGKDALVTDPATQRRVAGGVVGAAQALTDEIAQHPRRVEANRTRVTARRPR